MEKRLIELETRISYQDHMITELNDVIAHQQKQLEQLEKRVTQLHVHLKSLTSSGLAHPEEEAPPPHY